ncbi:AsmA family protein [Sediminicoccus sp. BL-A-41-H5]|uniref:AsmA family protein n=1 Tax=Sediminicoccus sp. BL-A-41-H5 TaxID=3421106 RepID=UPI003D667B56
MKAAVTKPDTPPAEQPRAAAPRRRWLRRALFSLAGLLVILAALPIAAWALLPRLELAEFAAGHASARLGRPVTIQSLRVSPGPRIGITASGVTIANIEGGTRAEMLTLDRATAELDLMALLRGEIVLPRAEVAGLSLLLERDAGRVANWRFGPAASAAAGRGGMPLFEAIRVTGAEILFRTTSGQMLPTRIEAASLTAAGLHAPIQLSARGSYNRVDLTLEGPLDSIASFRNAATPFGLDLTATAGVTTLALLGSARDPLNFDGVQGQIELRAANPDALLALGGAGTEGVPRIAFDLAGTFDRQGDVWRIGAPFGELDGAPFTGTLLQLTEGARGQPDALLLDLALTRLDLNRLLQAGGHEADGVADLPLAVFTAPDPLIELRLSAEAFAYGALEARAARLEASLVPGQVRIPTLAMQAFGARISAGGLLEADEEDLRITADVTMGEADLEPLRRALGLRELPLSGRVEGRLAVIGRGRSLNAAAREAHVSAVLLMSGGTIAREVIEMASTDIRALFRTARGRTRLACAIGVLDMKGGVGELAPLRLRSAQGMISGLATFDLNRHRLDLVIGSHRQTTGSFALDIPVRVSGSFEDPGVQPAQWSTAGRARLSAPDHTAPLPPALRDYARRSPCFFAGGR